MRKLYLLCAALIGFSAVSNAGVKNLYKQDFESVKTAAEAGWSSPNLADGMSIVSTEYGSWFKFSLGNNNNRNAVLNWNTADGTIYDGQDVKKYTVTFQWGHAANPKGQGSGTGDKNTQFSNEIAILPQDGPTTNNGQYGYVDSPDSARIFTITQFKGAYAEDNANWLDDTDINTYAFDFMINGDPNNKITVEEGGWYIVTVTVDTETKKAEYSIVSLTGETLSTGEYTLGEKCSPWARGINVLLGRYSSAAEIDDVKVQMEIEGDYANAPTVSLTELYLNKRTYQVLFEDGEILKGKTTEGTDISEVVSPYIYTTETSGTLVVWTEAGTAKSEEIKVEIDANTITLPAAEVAITKVKAGYAKEYKLTVDNSNVPTMPQITMTYEFKGASGNVITSPGEVPNGSTLQVEEKGTLTVTTLAYGFESSTMTMENDNEFEVFTTIDFQHMTEAELTGMGFAELDPLDSSTMSGENNWTARKRLWFGIENGGTDDNGNPTYDTHVVYGPTADGCEAIRRFQMVPSKLTKDMFAPMNMWTSADGTGDDVPAAKINYGIGLINTGVRGDAQEGSIAHANADLSIDGLTDNDFFIVYKINDYGTSSKHPIYPAGTSVADGIAMYKAENLGDGTMVEVYKGTESFQLYRIDTAIARIEVFKAKGGTGIQDINKGIASDANAPIYDLRGVQVTKGALQKGIYIQNGKKFVVK